MRTHALDQPSWSLPSTQPRAHEQKFIHIAQAPACRFIYYDAARASPAPSRTLHLPRPIHVLSLIVNISSSVPKSRCHRVWRCAPCEHQTCEHRQRLLLDNCAAACQRHNAIAPDVGDRRRHGKAFRHNKHGTLRLLLHTLHSADSALWIAPF